MANHINIVELIEKNPLTKLSNKHYSTFLSKVQQQFTSEEQQLFVSSFYCYLNYDPKKDFVIDLDDVWKWIGFNNKGNAKKVLVKHFTPDVDYKVLLVQVEKQNIQGGHNKEKVVLNIETFKLFCMISNTEKGKDIKMYYIKLETILQEIIDEESTELRQQLARAKEMITIQENAIASEKNRLDKLMRRNWYGEEPAQIVYVYQNNIAEGQSLIKIGKTSDISRRESDYNTTNQSGSIVYAKKCYNMDLLEKVVHHILDKHRVYRQREWFDVALDVAKQAVDAARMFLDELMPYSEDFQEKDLSTQLAQIIKTFAVEGHDHEVIPECSNAADIPNIYQQVNIESQQKIQDELEKFKLPEDIINPLDFDRFILECCDKSEDYLCLKADLYGAHKIWSRTSDAKTKNALYKYMHEKFAHGKRYFEEFNATLAIFKGIRPKPFVFDPQDPSNPTEYEQFIINRCKVGYTYRVSYKALLAEFELWKRSFLPDFALNLAEKKTLQDYVNSRFYPEHVYLSTKVNDKPGGGTNCHGIWGITLKEDNTNTGIKLSDKLRKKVYQIDVLTKKVAHVFESVTDAGKALGVVPSAISTDIRFGRTRNGFIYKLSDPDAETSQ